MAELAARNPARADARRERILGAVLACVEAGGFDALSMRAVAERAQVPLGSLHYYFRDKDEMVSAALALSVEELISAVVGDLDGRATPRRRLRRMLVDALPRLCDDPRTVPVFVGFWGWCRQQPGRRHLYREVSDRIHARARRLVAEGVAAGDFQVADVDAAAALLVSTALGFLLDRHGEPGGGPPEDVARLADAIERALGAA